MNLIFKPKIGLGNFILEKSIESYTSLYDFKIGNIDQFGEISYSLNDYDIVIATKNTIIVTIYTYKECLYKGVNIIGMDINDFIKNFNETYYGEVDELDFEEDNIPQYVYEFEDIGAQIWTKEDVIVTVILNKG